MPVRRSRHLRVIVFGVVVVIFFGSLLLVRWKSNQQRVLESSIKDANQIDVYLFIDGKMTYFSSLQYSKGLDSVFGEEGCSVFGTEISVENTDEILYPKDAGILLRFQFPESVFTLDVYCHRIKVDASMVSDEVLRGCFADIEKDLLFLVEVDLGIKLSEPKMQTIRMNNYDGQFYEILDKDFFSDIKQVLRERFYLDAL